MHWKYFIIEYYTSILKFMLKRYLFNFDYYCLYSCYYKYYSEYIIQIYC